jgi:hypothetical protein
LLVGADQIGTHDLVLYDGVQEVARAPKAVEIQPVPTQTATVRVRFEGPPGGDQPDQTRRSRFAPDERAAVVSDIDRTSSYFGSASMLWTAAGSIVPRTSAGADLTRTTTEYTPQNERRSRR